MPTRPVEPVVIGNELTLLVNEAMERTGRSALSVTKGICDSTGVHFSVKEGKLSITETDLRRLAPHMGSIRQYCRELPALAGPPPYAALKSQPSSLTRIWEGFWEHPFLYGTPLMAIFAVCMASIGPPKPTALESAELKASSGRGTEMTDAEAAAFRRKQEAESAEHRMTVTSIAETKRAKATDDERAVYLYMRRRFEALGNAYNPDIHDTAIANDAAAKFGISVNEANSIYYRLDY